MPSLCQVCAKCLPSACQVDAKWKITFAKCDTFLTVSGDTAEAEKKKFSLLVVTIHQSNDEAVHKQVQMDK